MKKFALLLSGVLLAAPLAAAQEQAAAPPDKNEVRFQALETRIRQLEEELRVLKASGATAAPAVQTATAPASPVVSGPIQTSEGTQLTRYGGASGASSKIFNPGPEARHLHGAVAAAKDERPRGLPAEGAAVSSRRAD